MLELRKNIEGIYVPASHAFKNPVPLLLLCRTKSFIIKQAVQIYFRTWWTSLGGIKFFPFCDYKNLYWLGWVVISRSLFLIWSASSISGQQMDQTMSLTPPLESLLVAIESVNMPLLALLAPSWPPPGLHDLPTARMIRLGKKQTPLTRWSSTFKNIFRQICPFFRQIWLFEQAN